jgi:hypothetical protein
MGIPFAGKLKGLSVNKANKESQLIIFHFALSRIINNKQTTEFFFSLKESSREYPFGVHPILHVSP